MMFWRVKDIRNYLRFKLWRDRPRYRGDTGRTILVTNGERVTVQALARPLVIKKSAAMKRLEDLQDQMERGEGRANAGDS